jgi:hypothetical protein
MSRSKIHGIWLFAAVVYLVAGCGSDDATDAPAGPPLSAKIERSEESTQAPVIDSIRFDPEAPVRGDRIQAIVVARASDGRALDISYRWLVDGEMVSGGDRQIDLAAFPDAEQIELIAIASDKSAESAEKRASVSIADRPPTVFGLGVEPREKVAPGAIVVAEATGEDPDGDRVEIEYEWFVNGESASVLGNEMSTKGLAMGDEIRVRATAVAEGLRGNSIDSSPVVVGSSHPEIVSNPPDLREGGAFVYRVEATDPDGDRRLRYRLDAAPEGMTIDEIDGRVEWHPTAKNVGVHAVSVVVRDSAGLETTQSFHVTVADAGSAPPAAPSD